MTPLYKKTLDLGNNESMSKGIFQNSNGEFLAMTYANSKTFKTLNGAKRWFKKMTGEDVQ